MFDKKKKVTNVNHCIDPWGIQHTITIDGVDVLITTVRNNEGRYTMVPQHVAIVSKPQSMHDGRNGDSYKFVFWESDPKKIKVVSQAMAIIAEWILRQEEKAQEA